ncbi:tetratricopeptide repeat protein [Geopsychrobacter electrodiphilus]|uniref:tetratricopeptide repeat protein n=1 Tax=Geopsychrobacter electrodiphilus TaxID=225196 RepID=UPI000376A82F|nr:tetratricopeptide repeat protein [Geopsychrobacter electrodiphilus]
MSLLNQVLRDLQQRQASLSDTGIAPIVYSEASHRRRIFLFLFILMALVLAFGATRMYLSHGPATPVPTIGQPALPVDNLPLGVADALVQPRYNQLQMIRLLQSSDSSRLLLEFAAAQNKMPEMLLDGRVLRIFITEIAVRAPQLPRVDPHGLIRDMDLSWQDHVWQLQLKFNTDVRTQKLVLAADGLHGERLAIDIFPLSAPVKTPVRGAALTTAVTRAPRPVMRPVAAPVIVHAAVPEAQVVKKNYVQTQAERAEELYQHGLSAVRQQKFEQASILWQQTLDLAPGHLQARKNLIRVVLPHDRARADALFAAGLLLHDPLALRKWYARILLPIYGPAVAVTVLDAPLGQGTNDPVYRALQAGFWLQAGNFEQAREAYLALLRHNQTNALYRFGLAVALDQLQQNTALQAYRSAVKGDLPPNLNTYALSRIEGLSTGNGAGN